MPTPNPSTAVTEIEVEAVPLTKFDEVLLDSFAKDVAAQATRMDDLAKQLVSLSIAVPSAFAAILKLIGGEKGLLDHPMLLLFAFFAWMVALFVSLCCLLPKRYEIDQSNLTDIQQYFVDSAQRKFNLLVVACGSSFVGVICAVLSLFN